MKRIMLRVAYDGGKYSGWQIQPNAPTIEGMLNMAINALTGEQIRVTGASRTDAGVHAYGNVAVFDTASSIPAERFAYALNTKLPHDISVVESIEVRSDFHPRHCNTVKTYEYRLLNNAVMMPQMRQYAWHIPEKLDIKAMNDAAIELTGEHDFKSFCSVHTQVESTVRTIYSIEVVKEQAGIGEIVTIRVRGNGFLYNMVRIIAGTLVQAGKGKISSSDVKKMLEACDRTTACQTAPPQGLTLVNIKYDECTFAL